LLYLASKDSLGSIYLIVSRIENDGWGERRLALGATETETPSPWDMNFVRRSEQNSRNALRGFALITVLLLLDDFPTGTSLSQRDL
jgi:hypothetical protein